MLKSGGRHPHRVVCAPAGDDSRHRPEEEGSMKRSIGLLKCLSLAVVVVVAATAGRARAGEAVPFKGVMEGVHVSRTPVDPPVVFDVFEVSGQATQLGQFDMVIEAVVDFSTRPPTGVGTLTFTAANG